jgi:hypothetical protein
MVKWHRRTTGGLTPHWTVKVRLVIEVDDANAARAVNKEVLRQIGLVAESCEPTWRTFVASALVTLRLTTAANVWSLPIYSHQLGMPPHRCRTPPVWCM